MLRLLKGDDDMASINQTFILLILNVARIASPEVLGQPRPITLCNVLYEIASKVMVNRPMVFLPEIIAEEKSAFVPGRLVIDNITTFECLHFMKGIKSKEHWFCPLKFDMRTTYDRLEWGYLNSVRSKMGFHRQWIDMTMWLVSTVSLSVLFSVRV